MAEKIVLQNENQQKLKWSIERDIKAVERKKLYIPRVIAEQIWAASVGKTEIRYNQENLCVAHGEILSLDHVQVCEKF